MTKEINALLGGGDGVMDEPRTTIVCDDSYFQPFLANLDASAEFIAFLKVIDTFPQIPVKHWSKTILTYSKIIKYQTKNSPHLPPPTHSPLPHLTLILKRGIVLMLNRHFDGKSVFLFLLFHEHYLLNLWSYHIIY